MNVFVYFFRKLPNWFFGRIAVSLGLLCFCGSIAGAQAPDISTLASELAQCHPQLVAARARVDGARASVDQARADRLPTFSVSAGAFVNDDQSDDTQASLNATLPLVTFGRQEANERVSAVRLALAEGEYSQSLAEHIEKLVGLWTARDADLQRIEIFEESLLAKQSFIEVIERRAEQGISSDAVLRDARTEYIVDVTEVENLRLQLLDVEADILALSCENVEIRRVVWTTLPVQASDIIIENHPDYVVQQQQLALAEREADLASVDGNPTLQLEGRVASNGSQDVSSRIGLTVNYEYESFGRGRRAAVAQADLQVREAENLLQFLRIDLGQQATSNFQRLGQLNNNIVPALQNELLNFQGAFDSSQRLYEAGRMTVREVLSDINSVKQTRLDLADAQQQIWSIYNDLAYASDLYTE
jgi:outer membrane protein TolC